MRRLDDEIRSHLLALFDGTSTVDAFEQWLVERTWDERSPLAARLDHLFAERTLLTDDELFEELRSAASTISDTRSLILTGASSVTLESFLGHVTDDQTIRQRLELSDTPPAAAHG